MGYANVLYNREKLPWKGDVKDKPSEIRCFKFNSKTIPSEPEKPFYFCIFNRRMDWGGKRGNISTSHSMFVNDNWVAALNMKLHSFSLELYQEKMTRSVGSIDCNAHIMEPIKFEIRLRVS